MTKRKRPTQPSKQKTRANKRAAANPNNGQPVSFFSRVSRKWLVGGGILLIALIAAFIFWQQRASSQTQSQAYVVGSVDNCANISPFMRSLGFAQNSGLDTRSKTTKGIVLRQYDTNGNVIRSHQEPSWLTAGYLGPFERDTEGNVFVIPVPAVNILDNPPEKANIIYRIAADSGVMAPFVDLPALAPANKQNPYGLLSLAYDCDTSSLYASSVYGSTYDHVAGRIFQVDSRSGQIVSSLDYVDAFGLGVFNTINGKRLFFGLARTPEIYSAPLNETGKIGQDIRLEPSLTVAGVTSDERAQDITFQDPNKLIIQIMKFDFNLIAPTEIRRTLLTYNYFYQKDEWQFVSSAIYAS